MAGLLNQFNGHGDVRAFIRRLRATPAADDDTSAATPPPSPRRPRRPDIATYRVRVDLVGARPPLWRRLELASDLMLDEVHDVIQTTFGWLDSHLHRFGAGPKYYSDETEYYLGPFESDEDGELGIPEVQVRLDEVLSEPGDKLFYNYDFGDEWQHVIELEAVLPRSNSTPRAVCTDGRRPGPPEDCGGVHGYELVAAATDPTRPDHRAALTEFARMYGDDVDPTGWKPTPFDMDAINAELSSDLGLDGSSAIPASDLPGPLADLLTSVRLSVARRDLRRLLHTALQHEQAPIDADVAAHMVGPYIWLLNHVGDDGITLTGAGYLPPAHVEAAWAELGLKSAWIGKGNREAQTLPVLHLRESAQAMGLLRKHRGRLLLTRRARDLRADPVALWCHLAERMPFRSKDPAADQAGHIVMVAIAADATDDLPGTVARILDGIGWVSGDGTPLTGAAAMHAAWDSTEVLRRIGALAAEAPRHPYKATPEGVAFARAAVRSWPR